MFETPSNLRHVLILENCYVNGTFVRNGRLLLTGTGKVKVLKNENIFVTKGLLIVFEGNVVHVRYINGSKNVHVFSCSLF